MNARKKQTPAFISLFLVGAFAAFSAFAGLWALPPLDRDEARFAQATTQMLESGDYISISFQDRERNKKPAGIYWLQAASVTALSDAEAREIWAYRVPSLFGVVFAALFTFFAARRLYDQPTAFLAALLISAAPVVSAEATIAKTDGVLLALICLAQWAFIEIFAATKEGRTKGWQHPLVFWLAQGGAILVKGPVAPMISALTGFGLLILTRKIGWIWRMRPIVGTLIVIIIVGPWLYAIQTATDGRFLNDALGGDMLGKVNSVQESHAGPPGYHTLLLWGLFWPAAALIGPGLIHIWRDRKQWQAQFLLSWIIPGWIVFEIAATKLPHYVMPLYPALAIVAAHAAVKDGRAQTFLRKAGAITYAGVGFIAAGLVAALPIILSAGPLDIACLAIAAIVAAASIIIAALFWKGRAYTGGVCAAIAAALYAWALMGAILPQLSQLALSPRLSTALELAERHPLHDHHAPIALAGYSEPSAVFLLGTQTVLTTGDNAARLLKAGRVSAAGIEARQHDAFMAELGKTSDQFRALTKISGFNYSNAKAVTITIYIPVDTPEK